MKKKNLIILTVLASSLIFIAVCLFVILFWVWYSQTHTGSRSGQVIDAVTGKPIEDAVVKFSWRISWFLQGALGSGDGVPVMSYEILTDKEGKYRIPNLRVKRESLLEIALYPEKVMIYKDGYAVYIVFDNDAVQVGRSFGYFNEKQPYRKKGNVARLYPWKEGESHDQQVNWINGWTLPSKGNELFLKELEPEKKRAKQELAEKWRQK